MLSLQQYGILKLLEKNAFLNEHYLECLTPNLTIDRIQETIKILSNIELRLPLLTPQLTFLAQQIHDKSNKINILENQLGKLKESPAGCLWGFLMAVALCTGTVGLLTDSPKVTGVSLFLALLFFTLIILHLSNTAKNKDLCSAQIAQLNQEKDSLWAEVSSKLRAVLGTDNIQNIQNFSSNLSDFIDSLKKIELVKKDTSLSETQKMLALESLFSSFHQKIASYYQQKELAHIADCAEQNLMLQQDLANEQRETLWRLQCEMAQQTQFLKNLQK